MTKARPPKRFTSAPCTVQTECLIADCANPTAVDAPLLLCMDHLRVAFAFYMAQIEDRVAPRPDPDPVKPVKRMGEKVGRVYFIRRGDFVKIGWSCDLKRRIRDLKGDALLWDQAGTMEDERLLHEAFDSALIPEMGHEWFYLTSEIVEFIVALRAREPEASCSSSGW